MNVLFGSTLLLAFVVSACWLDYALRKRRIAAWDKRVREFDEKARKWRDVV